MYILFCAHDSYWFFLPLIFCSSAPKLGVENLLAGASAALENLLAIPSASGMARGNGGVLISWYANYYAYLHFNQYSRTENETEIDIDLEFIQSSEEHLKSRADLYGDVTGINYIIGYNSTDGQCSICMATGWLLVLNNVSYFVIS